MCEEEVIDLKLSGRVIVYLGLEYVELSYKIIEVVVKRYYGGVVGGCL